MAAAGLGLAALALAGIAGGARADGHCGNATMASVAQSVPDLSTLVEVVTSVSEDAGQLTINGDEVEGPCNTAKVLQSVDVCESVVHVVDKVLLPAEFCAGASEEDTSKEDYTDGGSGDDAEES